jgi:hypothetical protein
MPTLEEIVATFENTLNDSRERRIAREAKVAQAMLDSQSGLTDAQRSALQAKVDRAKRG